MSQSATKVVPDAPILGSAPPVEGQTAAAGAIMLDAVRQMKDMATSTEGGKMRVVDPETHQIVEVGAEDAPEEVRQAVVDKVSRFLDAKLQGPIFVTNVRGKLFIGEYPRQQDILDVQRSVGNSISGALSTGELNMYVIEELRRSLIGWLPTKSPKVQLLRSHIDEREEWPRLGIELNQVEWMASRDPRLWEDEIAPLWKLYLAWKAEVEPTKEELDFYYSLM